MAAIVQASNISRHFGSARALDGVDLEVREGEIFGIVGPNGAGKTTLLNLCAGLDTPTSGTVEVFGLNPATSWDELASRVGVQMQSSALPPRLRIGEALELYSALYPEVRPWKDVLEELGIGHKEDARIEKLSGGERQRVFIALTLLHKPELAFLDEITTALDPQSRRDMWETVKHVRDNGATVVLTTHYMEEAEYLCDRVAIIDQGRLVACDSVPNLIAAHGGQSAAKVEFARAVPTNLELPGVEVTKVSGRTMELQGSGDYLPELFDALRTQDLRVMNINTRSAGLEDVFLSLTGKRIAEANAEGKS